jgi:hypothetical protein
LSHQSLSRRYWAALTDTPSPAIISPGRGREGYSLWRRYWASLVGITLTPRVTSTNAAVVPQPGTHSAAAHQPGTQAAPSPARTEIDGELLGLSKDSYGIERWELYASGIAHILVRSIESARQLIRDTEPRREAAARVLPDLDRISAVALDFANSIDLESNSRLVGLLDQAVSMERELGGITLDRARDLAHDLETREIEDVENPDIVRNIARDFVRRLEGLQVISPNIQSVRDLATNLPIRTLIRDIVRDLESIRIFELLQGQQENHELADELERLHVIARNVVEHVHDRGGVQTREGREYVESRYRLLLEMNRDTMALRTPIPRGNLDQALATVGWNAVQLVIGLKHGYLKDVNIAGLDVREVDFTFSRLIGLVWSNSTQWPPSLENKIRRMSQEISPGVYRVGEHEEQRSPSLQPVPTQ